MLGSTRRLDPRVGKWQAVRPMSTCRERLGSAVINGYLYAAGGSHGTCQLKTVEKYDPRINEWTSVADMNEVRVGMRLAVVNDRLYAVGGRGGADQETVE
ncbi:kelch repeat protein, partial [Cooperia oncophora]